MSVRIGPDGFGKDVGGRGFAYVLVRLKRFYLGHEGMQMRGKWSIHIVRIQRSYFEYVCTVSGYTIESHIIDNVESWVTTFSDVDKANGANNKSDIIISRD